MADTQSHPILHYLRRTLGAPAGGVADADLLHRFVAERDEAAFELLLWRHAAMVLHVCRQVLRDTEATEDAFQATFLVFFRKASSISCRESLGGWLYRVAYHVALKAQARDKNRQAAEHKRDKPQFVEDDADQSELRRLICEEVNRLPPKYRAPIVACYFEGKTHEEAAQQLGWPRGTVAGRLSRARELLRRRLVRRGVALTGAVFITSLSAQTSQAALTGLIDSTLQTTKLFVAGATVTPRITALAEGVLKAMYWTRMKIVTVVFLVAGFGAAGTSVLNAQRGGAGGSGEPPARADAAPNPEAGGGKSDDPAALTRNMAQSRLNLKKLASAMHQYVETHHRFPAPAIYGKDGKALLSWRVALLPYLDQDNLYKQFRLNESWDSPHNRKLLVHFPKVYAPPGIRTRQSFSTFYQVFVSAGAKPAANRGGGGRLPGGKGAGSDGPPGEIAPGSRGSGAGGPPALGGGRSPGTGEAAPSGGPPGGDSGGLPPGAKGEGSGFRGAGRLPSGFGSIPPGTGGAAGSGRPPGEGGDAGAGAGVIADLGITAAFVKGRQQPFPASITDGTSNTILIVEAGNPVPWTKPEDLHYAADEPLPELGGLFRDVFHAVFADGEVHTLTKEYDETQLRAAITSNGGEILDLSKIEAQPRRGGQARGDAGIGDITKLRRANEALRRELERAREQIRLLKEERAVQLEQFGKEKPKSRDPRSEQLLREQAQLRDELKKARREIEALKDELRGQQKPAKK
jgi:RNA polymerase sigma factor (sigma-70 family)